MNVTSNAVTVNYSQGTHSSKTLFTEKLSKDEVAELKVQIQESANAFSFNATAVQTTLTNPNDAFEQAHNDFQSFLLDIGYSGSPIAELSQEEASELISDDGIFGIKQTSERIANFVINGSGGDEDRMRAGREGMLQGFKDATDLLNGNLPDISKKTITAAIELVDKAMHDLGYSILDKEV